jgi:hypothetical protein
VGVLICLDRQGLPNSPSGLQGFGPALPVLLRLAVLLAIGNSIGEGCRPGWLPGRREGD